MGLYMSLRIFFSNVFDISLMYLTIVTINLIFHYLGKRLFVTTIDAILYILYSMNTIIGFNFTLKTV